MARVEADGNTYGQIQKLKSIFKYFGIFDGVVKLIEFVINQLGLLNYGFDTSSATICSNYSSKSI